MGAQHLDPDDEPTVVIPVQTLAEMAAEWFARINAQNNSNTETAS